MYFVIGAWAFAVIGIGLGMAAGAIDTGQTDAALWRKALYVFSMTLAAAVVAAALGTIYAGWLRLRRFSARWRKARVVPLGAGFVSWISVVLFYFPLYLALGQPTESTGGFVEDYAYLVLIPLVLVALAEGSYRLLKSIDADIPVTPQSEELP
ncbi:hypothetical protein [Botrimarina mediterranea]|uniref:hypothetical protein n=1 Tax=Botrimarina mediterranea TaxID=2528022 RepID=UPI00118B6040|nr:hypothetical protein K2D_22900 [Planctomycetes bacterium K2D]